MQDDPQLTDRIKWSDECEFRMNGELNKRNCCYWGYTNPAIQVFSMGFSEGSSTGTLCSRRKRMVRWSRYQPLDWPSRSLRMACKVARSNAVRLLSMGLSQGSSLFRRISSNRGTASWVDCRGVRRCTSRHVCTRLSISCRSLQRLCECRWKAVTVLTVVRNVSFAMGSHYWVND